MPKKPNRKPDPLFWERKRVILQSTLTSPEKFLLFLLDHHGRDEPAFAGQKRLAEEMSLSIRQVARLVRALVEKGVLHVQRRQRKSNVYTIQFDALEVTPSADQSTGLDRTSSSCLDRTPSADQEAFDRTLSSSPNSQSLVNRQKNRQNRNGGFCFWEEEIQNEEFTGTPQDIKANGLARFKEAKQRAPEHLREPEMEVFFLATWIRTARETENGISHPGAFMAKRTQKLDWKFDSDDYPDAKRFIERVNRKPASSVVKDFAQGMHAGEDQ